ncbi:MAG: MATE family efflux transporter, partial [Clostridia bacterium]|nr:MATE family efflux transporter [Clostridia bacterium]
ATVIGQIVACGLAIFFNYKKNTDLRLSFKGFRPEGRIIGGIASIGVPSIIMVAVGSVMTFLFNIILITFTTAGHYSQNVFGIYFKLNSFIFMPIFGLNNGVVPIIAYNYGAQKRKRMLKTIKIAICIAIALMAIGMLLFMLIPEQLLGLFISNATPEETAIMLSIGKPALRIICTHFIFAAVCISFNSIFQALGKGTYAMITSICRQLVILLPAAYILARIGFSIGNDNLVWISFPIAELASLIVSVIFFLRLNKKLISKIKDTDDLAAAV